MGYVVNRQIYLPFANEDRTIRIYLPKAYDEFSDRHFPVLYMHDGQNLFDDATASYGNCWKIKDTMDMLEESGQTEGFIIVGLDNNGATRFDEYSPWRNTIGKSTFIPNTFGGKGAEYADFFVNTLKPFIENEYRTLTDKKHNAIAGSSMGGFISAYIMAKYAEVYQYAGIFSLASWFAEEDLLKFLYGVEFEKSQKYFVQVGTNETSDPNMEMAQLYLNNTLNYYRLILRKGINVENTVLHIGVGDIHNEVCWAKYMERFLMFLFK